MTDLNGAGLPAFISCPPASPNGIQAENVFARPPSCSLVAKFVPRAGDRVILSAASPHALFQTLVLGAGGEKGLALESFGRRAEKFNFLPPPMYGNRQLNLVVGSHTF